MRVLVVDDNAVNRRVAVAMLEKLGQAPQVAASGGQALQLCRTSDLDVIFMDVWMPGLDGYVTTRLIRAAGGRNRPRIIAMTADDSPEDREACLAAGMDDYVSKPLRAEPLAAALQRAVASLG